jgi:hypothetical protein
MENSDYTFFVRWGLNTFGLAINYTPGTEISILLGFIAIGFVSQRYLEDRCGKPIN